MSTQIKLIDKLREKLLIEKIPSYPVGFLTQDKRFFPISSDTKLLSKILEITLMGYLRETIENELTEWGVGFCEAQNQYPDFFLFNRESKEMIAIDFKSTYLKDKTTISGFTLGTFNGYFKNQEKRMCCYWIYFLNQADALKRIRKFYKDFVAPYSNFEQYINWVRKGRPNLNLYKQILELF